MNFKSYNAAVIAAKSPPRTGKSPSRRYTQDKKKPEYQTEICKTQSPFAPFSPDNAGSTIVKIAIEEVNFPSKFSQVLHRIMCKVTVDNQCFEVESAAVKFVDSASGVFSFSNSCNHSLFCIDSQNRKHISKVDLISSDTKQHIGTCAIPSIFTADISNMDLWVQITNRHGNMIGKLKVGISLHKEGYFDDSASEDGEQDAATPSPVAYPLSFSPNSNRRRSKFPRGRKILVSPEATPYSKSLSFFTRSSGEKSEVEKVFAELARQKTGKKITLLIIFVVSCLVAVVLMCPDTVQNNTNTINSHRITQQTVTDLPVLQRLSTAVGSAPSEADVIQRRGVASPLVSYAIKTMQGFKRKLNQISRAVVEPMQGIWRMFLQLFNHRTEDVDSVEKVLYLSPDSNGMRLQFRETNSDQCLHWRKGWFGGHGVLDSCTADSWWNVNKREDTTDKAGMNVLHQNKKCLCPATSRSVESRLVLRDCANCAIGNGWQLQTGKLSFVVDTHTKPSCIAKSKQTKKLKLIGCEDSTNSKTAVIQSLAASVPQTKSVVVRTKSDEHLLVHTEQLVNYDFIFIA